MKWAPLRNFPRLPRACGRSAAALSSHRLVRGPPFDIAFFGSDRISLATLKKLYLDMKTAENPVVRSLRVISCDDKPKSHGRGAMVKSAMSDAVVTKNFAMEMGIPWYQVPRGIDFRMTGWEIPRNVSHGCHLGVVVSFGYKIPSSLIQNYPLGMINMHPSILPKYRGAAPIPRAIMNGDSEIGVSIIEIHPELMDGGEILLQEKHPIKEDDTFPVLAEALAEKGAENVIKVIRDLAEYRKNANPVTLEKFRSFPLAKKIKSEEGRIVWEEMTAAEIYCRYRGLKGLVSIFANLKGKRVNLTDIESESKIREIAIEPIKDLDQWSKTPSPGLCKAIFCKPDQTSGSTKPEILLVIQCKGGSIIGVRKLHIETKKEIKAREFVNGYLCQVKEIHFN